MHRNTVVEKREIDSENIGSYIYLTEDWGERGRRMNVVINEGIEESTCTCSMGDGGI